MHAAEAASAAASATVLVKDGTPEQADQAARKAAVDSMKVAKAAAKAVAAPPAAAVPVPAEGDDPAPGPGGAAPAGDAGLPEPGRDDVVDIM